MSIAQTLNTCVHQEERIIFLGGILSDPPSFTHAHKSFTLSTKSHSITIVSSKCMRKNVRERKRIHGMHCIFVFFSTICTTLPGTDFATCLPAVLLLFTSRMSPFLVGLAVATVGTIVSYFVVFS